ncbi:PD-(D/E)XK nuclease family protein [Lamprobacter modestohalophilus]|uniref:PD-(D/E)XK nuclease family protein n=1 Tax=Lamprobacter modestohalophilus TaxID=1064514 RepID=UPI002ADEBDF6|nr:PD-(D/E)XK nuclease family protein [Lamprobacter modestohalophilus]MEA1053369.1 PD-(D/E)XK nuclease family protein [Lamprobacter modestohalophilus]
MWDFNATATVSERLEALVDAGLQTQRDAQPPRHYLGASRLGAACERQLQYESAQAPVDPGRAFSGRLLRIFERGHRMEEAMAGWLRAAGFVLETEAHDGQQFGFSALDGRLQGHVDGVLRAGPDGLSYPALWESKCVNASSWRQLAKSGLAVARPTYAAQVALYQAYLELHRHPALFTAINADTLELYAEAVPFDAALAQRMSDRAVRVITATEAGELLPRGFAQATHLECRFCAYAARCWGGGA